MYSRSIGGLAAVAVLFALCATAARADDACWNLLYSSLHHNASTAQAPFVSYSESLDLEEDGQPIEYARANVTYRDDGMASIDDNRFAHPFLSPILDPGPPVLGPYGSRRDMWLAFGISDATLPIIADTKTVHRVQCNDLGDETIQRGRYAHLVFSDAHPDRLVLKSVWLDRARLTIRRVVVSEPVNFSSGDGDNSTHYADYTLEVAQVDGHDVITQINWGYSYWQFGQRTDLREEYKFGEYHFAKKAPAGTLFADAGN
ncbi:MAG TPA: hypothetical protein VNF68_13145 [Candidatus Baltobacteraceae bacterium]|nr:hypothetical protein [Candidatus Baltobacteraceae bacterium]